MNLLDIKTIMDNEKYSNYPLSISAILGLIEANDIAIPEIQRPFVWKKTQVRDLIDSLYKGYPTGYIILWKNPNVKLKDGTISSGKKVLIDGQQRITALMTAVAGRTVFNSDYQEERIKIAFDPFAALSEDPDAEIFAVATPAIRKSKRWIPDIAELFATSYSSFKFIPKYCEDNPEIEPEQLEKIISKVKGIANRMIGVIELSENLDIDIVTDIFIRINSKGTALSQGDFVMSKIAADEKHGGNTLRKVIDYFSLLAVVPSFYDYIASHDKEFAATPYLQKLKWLKDDTETVYDPECDDVIRVAFMHKLKRAKLADLVSLLSGRNFVFLDRPVNISIGKKAPNVYLKEAKERCMNTSAEQTGLINDTDKFYANLETNCVPLEAIDMDFNSYDDFLEKRRKMMAAKIKKYYYSL